MRIVTGESLRQLWSAVVLRAVMDVRGKNLPHGSGELVMRDAYNWIMRDDMDSVNSFRHLCAYLGFDYRQIRRRVREMAVANGLVPAGEAAAA